MTTSVRIDRCLGASHSKHEIPVAIDRKQDTTVPEPVEWIDATIASSSESETTAIPSANRQLGTRVRKNSRWITLD